MSTQIILTPNQTKTLTEIVAGGKVATHEFDGRTVRSLESHGFVKVTSNKKGTFVAATAKGKKATN